MFNNYLQAIEGIEIYPVIGLIIFLIVFISVVVWVIKIDKNYIREAERIPLDNDNEADETISLKNLTGGSNETKV
ncbi:cbb3-type cytochrome c oxidase subunit 3 [bacterium BMS3Abin03]|jgi:cytochrome c oxidase cbb3-type subunit 4|nr:cbb3-type cytochrome c oxidase subunit 3 [bacterium BMS3Abin03]MCG6959235.1 cbb3-type cytochrome c oxidase subunit 3 [bacterium BMS3Abin03]